MKILYVYRYKYILIIITLWFLYMSFVAYHLRLVVSLHSRSQYWFPHTWKWTFLFAKMSFLFMHMLTPPVVRIFFNSHVKQLPIRWCYYIAFYIFQKMASQTNVVYSYNLLFFCFHAHLVYDDMVKSAWIIQKQQIQIQYSMQQVGYV